MDDMNEPTDCRPDQFVRSRARMGKLLVALVVCVGCAAPFQGVRQRGGEILKCPAQHLAVERTSEFEFKATGCGYSIAVVCATPDGQLPCTTSPQARAPVYAPN